MKASQAYLFSNWMSGHVEEIAVNVHTNLKSWHDYIGQIWANERINFAKVQQELNQKIKFEYILVVSGLPAFVSQKIFDDFNNNYALGFRELCELFADVIITLKVCENSNFFRFGQNDDLKSKNNFEVS